MSTILPFNEESGNILPSGVGRLISGARLPTSVPFRRACAEETWTIVKETRKRRIRFIGYVVRRDGYDKFPANGYKINEIR
jgi:hypothetical protein